MLNIQHLRLIQDQLCCCHDNFQEGAHDSKALRCEPSPHPAWFAFLFPLPFSQTT
jgi:hypothetical protein